MGVTFIQIKVYEETPDKPDKVTVTEVRIADPHSLDLLETDQGLMGQIVRKELITHEREGQRPFYTVDDGGGKALS